MKIELKDLLWLLIPIGIILLIYFSVIYVPAEPYDPDIDSRAGGTCHPLWCD